ncbi:MAG: hypothetical protein GY842_08040, partial [bacterium]|nr:hypothetical protein [bacterium]
GIPYFIDRRRPTTHHPLVEWLRGLVQLAVDGFAPGTAALLLKTGLLSIDRADAERVENHLIATELIGVSAWTRTWKPVLDRWRADDRPSRQRAVEQRHERLNQARQEVFDQLAPWVEFARDQEARSARTWAEGITAELERFGIHTQLEEWACSAEQDGDLDRAAEHRQIIRDVGELLEDLAGVLPDEPLTLGQLAQMLDSALAQFTLGLTPPTLDQVLVSGIERSRNPDLRVLFLLGFNDGAFPAAPAEDAILNDDDREWLESRGMELPPSSRTRLLEERLLAYVAFTRPSRKLVVSYAALDASGSQLSPSPYLEDLLAVCPQATQPFVDDPFRSRSDWSVRNPADLSAHLAHEFSARPPRELDDSPRRGFWNALYERVRIDPRIGDSVRRTLAALDYDNRAALSKSSVANAYHQLLHTSVSRLETFATCPFKHFAEWNLKLEPRRSVRLQPVDVGKIHHAVLELVVERVIHEQRSLVDLTEVELTTLLDQALGEVTESLPEASSAATARDRYILERSRSQLGRVLRAQQALAALGAFLPVAAELRFGFTDGGGLPPLEVDTPDGRQVCLRGIIDRVDLAGESPQTLGLVVDYKRTRDKRLDLCSVYHGLALQLLTYLLVLEQQGLDGQPVVPGGALYLSLLESYERVAHPDDAAPTPEATAGLFQPRGLLDLAHVGQVDRTFTETGRSENYQVALKKDGTLSRVDSSDAAGSADFRLLLGRVRQCIGRHADGILDGNVAVSPYRLGTFSPCSWCDLQAVCRFEFPTSTVRYLEKMKRSAVFAQLRG